MFVQIIEISLRDGDGLKGFIVGELVREVSPEEAVFSYYGPQSKKNRTNLD